MREVLRASAAALSLLLGLATQAAAQPRTEVVYDWSTGGFEGPALRAGQQVRFRVDNVNPLCYRATIKAEVTNAAVDVSDLLGQIRASTQTQPQPQPAPVPSDQPDTVDAQDTTQADPVRRDLNAIRQLLDAAEANLTSARTHLQAAESQRAEAAYVLEALTKPNCEAGRGFDFDNLVARWRGLSAESSPGRELAPALAHISRAEEDLEDATERLNEAVPIPESEALADRANELRAQHDLLNGQRRSLAQTLPSLASALATVSPRLAELAQMSRSAIDDVRLGHSAERVKVTITSHALTGTNAPALDPIVREVPVERQFRAFLSTGVVVTTIEQPHYERVHRQAVDAGGVPIADSTYLTYASNEKGTFSSFSPAIQLNVSLVPEPVSMYLSFGATGRTVNGSLGVEPVLGLSAGLLDRLLVTAGWHWGRREKLLIGSPSEIAGRPVPEDITRPEAVGTRWKHGGFLSFSIRM